jgi:hypothetical protein
MNIDLEVRGLYGISQSGDLRILLVFMESPVFRPGSLQHKE